MTAVMAPVSAMAAEEMHQRAQQEKGERDELKHVRPVLKPQVINTSRRDARH
jgi:hypothetical protein